MDYPEKTTLDTEPGQTPEGQDEDSQNQAEEAALKEALNQTDIDALFEAYEPPVEEKPSETEGEEEPSDETGGDEQELSEEKTTAKDVPYRYAGTIKVLGKSRDVDLEGDELTRVIQKGYTFDEYEKWGKDAEAEARADERQKTKAEMDEHAVLHKAVFDDFMYLLRTNSDFKEIWDEAKKDYLPSREQLGRMADKKPESKKDPEYEKLRREFEEVKQRQEEEALERMVEKLINDFSKANPDVDVKAVMDYAVENGFKFDVFGKYVLQKAYYAMLGEGKIKPPKPKAGNDKGDDVVVQIKHSKKIPPIPAGSSGVKSGKVSYIDMEDKDFKREMVSKIPSDPDELFK